MKKLLPIFLVPAVILLAAISVYAIPLPGVPTDFTLTYISNYEVGVSWTKGDGAVNTMVRGAVGEYPETRTDGYLVYYGEDESCSDTGVSLDETTAVYYRAWSENAEGGWSSLYAEAKIGGVSVTLIFIGILGMGFLVLAFAFKQMVLAWLAGLTFIALAVIGWTNSEALYDTYWVIGFLGILALLVCFIMGFVIQNKAAQESYEKQQRYDKEFPPEVKLSEEDQYSKDLDDEVDKVQSRAKQAKGDDYIRSIRRRRGL